MPLPQRAVVEATPSFLTHLRDARAFLAVQDEATAARRSRGLQAELREMVEILAWAPGTGRPARFLSSRSAQGRLRAQRVRALDRAAYLAKLPDAEPVTALRAFASFRLETSGGRLVKREHALLACAGVQTVAGKVQVRWETDSAAKPLGQLAYFIEFLQLTGLWSRWQEDCPLSYTSPSAPSTADVSGRLF
jgi:hypothetical protein